MYCKNCGSQINEGQAYCNNCGSPLETTVSNKPKKENKKLIIILGIVAFLILIAVSIIIFNYEKEPTYDERCPYAYDCVRDENGEFDCKILNENLEEEDIKCQTRENIADLDYEDVAKFEIYQETDTYSDGSENKKYYIYDAESQYKNGNKVFEYECKNKGCKVLDIDDQGKYMFIYDKLYFIYNNESKTIVNYLDVDYVTYSNVNLITNKNTPVGLIMRVYRDEEFETAYFDIESNDYIIDFGKFNDISTDKSMIENGYVFYGIGDVWSDDYKYGIYNLNNKTIYKENIRGVISSNNSQYYYDGGFSEFGPLVTKIYDNKFNLIYTPKGDYLSDYVMGSNGELVIADQGKFYVFDNYKLKYESKKYENIYLTTKDYVVVNNNGYLSIVNNKGEEVAKFTQITDDITVHSLLSGWYTENGKNGIYIVVGDERVTLDDFDEDKRKEYENLEWLGYEYYYIPTTGETGEILTGIGGYAKPVLYLYPEEDNTKVDVTFNKPKLLTTTYPKYKNGWSVVVNKNGDLYDFNGRYYYGLYWEEIGSTDVNFNTGFYVTKENASEFLEEKLEEIGLTQREANEFIMYWLPVLEKNEKSLVYFELTEERQVFNRININPMPDSLLRMAIHIKKVNEKVDIIPQQFTKFERSGFTAIEWGGVIH